VLHQGEGAALQNHAAAEVANRWRSNVSIARIWPLRNTYTQVVVATGTKLIFVSGQEPEDVHGKLVGHGDLAVQARQVFTNLGRALAGAGARPTDVARTYPPTI
jgi:enamine deaminase RidA (YjgF/YER057c/UK114 family)